MSDDRKQTEKPPENKPPSDQRNLAAPDRMAQDARKQLQGTDRDDRSDSKPGSESGRLSTGDQMARDARAKLQDARKGDRSGPKMDRNLSSDEKPERALKSAAHAGADMGERDAAFLLGQRGVDIVLGPGGEKGHKLTSRGLDIVGFDPSRKELWLVDNKATGGTRKIEARDASAVTENLRANLTLAIKDIRSMQDFPNKATVLDMLDTTLHATEKGEQLPKGVRLVVTNAGGYATGVRRDLASKGVEFVDVIGPEIIQARRSDIRTARDKEIPSGRPTTLDKQKASPEGVARLGAALPESDNIRLGTEAAVARQQVRAEKVAGAGLAIATVLDALSNHLQESRIQKKVENQFDKSKGVIEQTLGSGNGVFVVVRIEQCKFPDNNGNIRREFNTMYLIPAKSFDDGMTQWRKYPILETSRGEDWAPTSQFAFIPPR